MRFLLLVVADFLLSATHGSITPRKTKKKIIVAAALQSAQLKPRVDPQQSGQDKHEH
ncbi:hypothetical protein TSAR_013235 [Trichomalopsis sarcophagae]|uniref:Secreted protein n=1 Tax=Trichomalopsis sarcophagae TaxID=543379 RepID=A0A232EX41_9HYME|nr:hypothetical protein TSAR_013235 [Trichomalopsis sarcophagae]